MLRFFIPAFLISSAIASEVNANDCKSFEDANERLECYDRKAANDKDVAPSSSEVNGTVTWKYNDLMGSRADIGSKVFLVPHPLEDTFKGLKDQFSLPLEGALSIFGREVGAYKAEVDGLGKYSISNVSGGFYDVLIVSKNAETLPMFPYNNRCRERYKDYEDGVSFGFNKVSCESIHVEAGLPAYHNHDFGLSDR